jgi:hypothetical protein
VLVDVQAPRWRVCSMGGVFNVYTTYRGCGRVVISTCGPPGKHFILRWMGGRVVLLELQLMAAY